jgi:tetratricopeptide (TPR) repeat protein
MSHRLAFALCLTLVTVAVPVRADDAKAGPAARLKRLVAKLQDKPDDIALRGMIIDLAKTMNPKPVEPDEVDELKGMAAGKFEKARSEEDYAAAADAFAKVTLAAPWVGDYYLNLGLALDKAGKPEAAIANLRLYLKANPKADDARQVRVRIGKLRAAAESGTSSPPPAAAPGPSKPAEPDFTGEWSECSEALGWPCPGGVVGSLTREGDEWIFKWYGSAERDTLEVSGRHLEIRGKRKVDGYEDYSLDLSEDGQRMEGTRHAVTNAGWAAGCETHPCEGTSPVHFTKKR